MPFPYTFPFVLGEVSAAVVGPLTGPAAFSDDATTATETDFGFDVMCLPDLDTSLTPRNDRLILADAIARRYTTPRGKLPFFPDYGEDLREWLNDEVDAGMLAAMRAAIEAQAEQDERVEAAAAAVFYNPQTQAIRATVQYTTAAGPFAHVLDITKLSVDVLYQEA